MIVFETEFSDYFNKKIHNFLHVYFVDAYDPDDPYDRINGFFPNYLIREQKEKCLTTFEELFEWTGDKYWHNMSVFHEMGLYHFLGYIHNLREDMPEFDSIFYDVEDKKDIEFLWGKFDIKAMFEGSMKNVNELASFLHDLGTMQELCFEDTDFLLLPDLSNNHSMGNMALEKLMGIDFDYYIELLPKDIRDSHEKQLTQLGLLEDLWEMLNFISNRVQYHGLNKSFWHEDRPAKEPEIQILLDSIFAAYLKDKSLDISREVDIATGKIDFKFYRNHKERVLIEVKRGNNLSLVKKGIETQLPHYMDATNCEDAFYLVICYSEKDTVKVQKFFEGYKTSRNIVPFIFDVSKKTTASKL